MAVVKSSVKPPAAVKAVSAVATAVSNPAWAVCRSYAAACYYVVVALAAVYVAVAFACEIIVANAAGSLAETAAKCNMASAFALLN